MSRKHFGTDGVRGVANRKLNPELAFALGLATGKWAQAHSVGERVVLGADTRQSGPMLASALAAGFCSAGIGVLDVGVAPTPAISYLARKGPFCLGAIVSASHNPAPDNGIKFVGPDGKKLTDAQELEIEALIDQPSERPMGSKVGSIERSQDLLEGYLLHLVDALPEGLAGWKVAMDCAHGAAYEIAPELLRRLGAEVVLTGVEPDGMNINAEGGATKPETIESVTKYSDSMIGVAFDGDADRAIFCDNHGRLINGDRTMGIWAVAQKKLNRLSPPRVVGTVMSNGGFEHYLAEQGIQLDRAAVGDKYVSLKIEETHALIGGEQSGHIIFPKHGPTGDGLMTMIELFRVLRLDESPVNSHAQAYEPWPQLLVNMAVGSTDGWSEKIADELEEANQMLVGNGRVLVRPSGTQPVIRVMTEAVSYDLRDKVSQLLCDALQVKLKGHVVGRVDLTHALGD